MRWPSALMWGAMAACLVAGGILLLSACDFQTPYILSFGGAFCPQKIDLSALNNERGRQEELKSKIHEEELQFAGIPDCPPAPNIDTEGDKARKKAYERGGKSGRLQITLSWRTKDDLDLEVECSNSNPFRWLGYLAQVNRGPGKGQCGDGKIDVDANSKMINPINDPVENAVWNSDIPDFLTINVYPFKRGSAAPINYWVSIKFDDEERLCTGTVNPDDSMVDVLNFLTSTHPIPDCDGHHIKYCKPGPGCAAAPEK